MVNILDLRPKLQAEARLLWLASPPLAATALLMLIAFVASVPGIFLDHRIITGVPAWVKPAKFAISTAIYTGTLAWFYRYLTVWPRFVRVMVWIVAVVIVLEVVIIDLQAARGTTSHFNTSTPLDAALFGIMGAAIGILWLASVGILAALFRQPFADGARAWALRLGMLITVVGAASGGFMLRPTTDQSVMLTRNVAPSAIGGHTVGAADGGPGLPFTGWSTEHGDLRIPHFFGLHAIQIVPFLAWIVSRRRYWRQRRAAVAITAGLSYLTLVFILAWQALRGEAIIRPDGATLAAFAAWFICTLSSLFVLGRNRENNGTSKFVAAQGRMV
jgi:hypothetical protein